METFARHADEACRRPLDRSGRRAAEVLPTGGSVLDVGCGAGAASLPLVQQAGAGRLVGVDESAGLLAAFAERAERLGVAHEEVEGRWPDVAHDVGPADVVVCRNVVYNLVDLDAFAARLTGHARHRVVVHLTVEHPLAWMAPYWRELHGLERPRGPTACDAIDVVEELGCAVAVERWDAPWSPGGPEEADRLAFLRRRLCLPAGRDDDLRAAFARHGVPDARPVATLWWEGASRDLESDLGS